MGKGAGSYLLETSPPSSHLYSTGDMMGKEKGRTDLALAKRMEGQLARLDC
jgi:hypothetical protein